MLENVTDHIASGRDRLISLQRALVAIPALGPDNGGDGERAKADFLMDYLRAAGVTDVRDLPAPDDRVSGGQRPNVMALLPGHDTSRTMWVIGHTDIVPPGDLATWDGDPYLLREDGDVIYGRGVEDNHQGVCAGVLLAEALAATKTVPPINLGLLLVADEETASTYGLDFVVREHSDLLGRDDLFVIPDFGVPDSTMIEVAEKSMCWLKVTVSGKQCHASTPEQGVNSLVAASAFVLKLRALYEKFDAVDELFAPPFSTFEATKKEANVPNVNTIPGRDVFYVDCRILPQYPVDEVLAAIKAIGQGVAETYGVRMEYETVQRQDAAPATPPDAEVVTRLQAAIQAVYGVQAKPAGIGGGTVAAFLRKRGFQAAVWETCQHSAHQPNERAIVSDQLRDAQVLAHALFAQGGGPRNS